MTQEDALEILKLGHNVFLTGSAGSGKTFVLQKYIQYLREKDIPVGVTASTGVAATHIQGVTINSWAGIGIKQILVESDVQELLKRPYLKKRFLTTQVLVIDEVSMLTAASLDSIDMIAQAFRGNPEPFGGMQVLLCGDFFQLPPISQESSTPFIFKSNAWQRLDLKVCYLEKEYRQSDGEFLQVLHEIRDGSIRKDSIRRLAGRLYKDIDSVSTRLYTHNVNVDQINQKELDTLSGEVVEYDMESSGNDYLVSVMRKTCLAPELLQLKKGALVMFVKNNFEKGYVNGTLGTVLDFDEKGRPLVETSSGSIITVYPATWTIEEEGRVKAQIRQLPLRLAWAITVHKSQGMTLDGAEIDLRNPFAPGMGYVALSRVRRLEGIRLLGLNHKALVVNSEVTALDKILREKSKRAEEELAHMEWLDKEVNQLLFVRNLKHAYSSSSSRW